MGLLLSNGVVLNSGVVVGAAGTCCYYQARECPEPGDLADVWLRMTDVPQLPFYFTVTGNETVYYIPEGATSSPCPGTVVAAEDVTEQENCGGGDGCKRCITFFLRDYRCNTGWSGIGATETFIDLCSNLPAYTFDEWIFQDSRDEDGEIVCNYAYWQLGEIATSEDPEECAEATYDGPEPPDAPTDCECEEP